MTIDGAVRGSMDRCNERRWRGHCAALDRRTGNGFRRFPETSSLASRCGHAARAWLSTR